MSPIVQTKPRYIGNARGNAVVEFALVLPILLLALFGITEFGRMILTTNILNTASREGARLAAVSPAGETATIEARVNEVLAAAKVQAKTITVEYLSAANSVRALGSRGAGRLHRCRHRTGAVRRPGGRRAGLPARGRDAHLQHAAASHGPRAAQAPAALPGIVHRRHAVGREPAGRPGRHARLDAWPHRLDRRHAPVPDGAPARDGTGGAARAVGGRRRAVRKSRVGAVAAGPG